MWLIPLFTAAAAHAGPDLSLSPAQAEERFSFAEMYLGADVRMLIPGGELAPSTLTPRFWIGATHFWGHADFYVAFDLPGQILLAAQGGDLTEALTLSIETGGKLYPWALQPDRVVPWVGAALAPVSYTRSSSAGTGPLAATTTGLLTAGVAARLGPHIIEAGGGWIVPTQLDAYPTSLTERADLAVSGWSTSLRYKYSFDTTSARIGAVRSGRLLRELEAVKGAGLEVAIGPSSSFPFGSTTGGDLLTTDAAGSPAGSIFPEVGLGWYSQRTDAAIRTTWRRIKDASRGYDQQRGWSRQSVSVEAIKMVADYHGFVPFVGPGVSVNRLDFTEVSGETAQTRSDTVLTPEIVFGWDIRPTNAELFLLRTNLRVAPLLALTEGDTDISFRVLEFNFIQFVFYPQRAMAFRGLN